MHALLRRLLGQGGTRRGGVECYLRENGPIAYQLEVFGPEPRERADAMMSSELSWAWKSATREWTELTRISLSAFLADLSSRQVLLAGLDGEPPAGLGDAQVKAWIRSFCRTQPSPLAAVISIRPDRELLFVQQHASDPVNRLLEAWSLDKRGAQRKSYARLGPASLEALEEGGLPPYNATR